MQHEPLKCPICWEPITTEQETITPESFGGLPTETYHKICYEKNQQAFHADIERNSQRIVAKEIEQERHRQELRENLLRGKWFIQGAEAILRHNPVYFDRTGAWWVWNQTTACWVERDETDVLVMCRKTLELIGDTSIRHSRGLLEALRQVSRGREPKEPPLEYIQFGKTFFNINTGEQTTSTPDYFSTNQIPWEPSDTHQTPELDRLITSWVGHEYLQTVYEIIAYCTYRDYPIHRIFCFVGTGANGKTRLLKIIERFVGQNNKASVTLKKIGNNDFALYPLYRKTVCFVGETAHHRLESTEILKALSGQDPVSFEDKGRTAFTGQNYAKMIVGTNVLPPSSDTSRGWYRRWFVLRFPNEFDETEDVLKRIPDAEYNALARKTIMLLPALLRRGGFHNEGTIEDRQARYVQNSNPLKEFISLFYERDHNSKVRYTECYLDYLQFLSSRKLRKVSKREFSSALDDESLETQKTSTKDPITNETSSFNVIWGLRRLEEQRNFNEYSRTPSIPDLQVGSIFASSSIIDGVRDREYREYGNTGDKWYDWLNKQPGGTVTTEELTNWLMINEPNTSIKTLLINGEIYEPRPGIVRSVLK